MKNHPMWGADVARQARLSDRIVNIILYHQERYDGKGNPAGLMAAGRYPWRQGSWSGRHL